MGKIAFYKGLESNLPEKSLRDSNSFYVTTDTGKIILGENVWNKNSGGGSSSNVEFTTAKTETHFELSANGSKIFSVPIVKFQIASNIVDGEIDNKSVKIEYGETFTCNVMSNHVKTEFKNVIILMGGINKTNEWFDSKLGKITIPEVCGNISISLTCSEIANVVGSVSANNDLSLNTSMLKPGTYTLKYEDENGPLDSFGIITDNAKI